MRRFTYVSRDVEGRRTTAVAEAESRQSLLGQLKERGVTVVDIREFAERREKTSDERKKDTKTIRWYEQGVSLSESSIFWREFATMVSAGLPVSDALESITKELEHKRFRRVLNDVVASMWEGFSLSQSISRHPGVFSPMVIALISAAEESGSLPEVAEQLATYLEGKDRLLRKVRTALTYPIFLCGFFFVVLIVATFWIIPKFKDIYQGFGAKLPWLTETVFAINTFILGNFLWIVIGSAALTLAFVLWARRPSGRWVIDRAIIRLPIFGKIIQRASVARFCKSLAILLSGGIPISRGLEMAQQTSGNSLVAKAVGETREDILKGSKIAASLKKHEIFPHLTVRMVSAGEETGNLSGLLEKVADFYESRVDAALSTINSLIEPILIVVVGVFALLFVLSMYMPIFSLAASMGG